MLNLQNGSEEQNMTNIHGSIYAVVPRFRFHIRHQTKHVRQCLPKICQFYNVVSILNIGQSLGNDWLPVKNVKNWDVIFTTSVVEWNCNVTVAEWYKCWKCTFLGLWSRWSNGQVFILSSGRPEIESRRGCCWLSFFTSFFKLDRFFFSLCERYPCPYRMWSCIQASDAYFFTW